MMVRRFSFAVLALAVAGCSSTVPRSSVDPLPQSASRAAESIGHDSLLIAADSMKNEIIALNPYAKSSTAPVWVAHTNVGAGSFFPLDAARDSSGRLIASMRNFPGVAIFNNPASNPAQADAVIAGSHTQLNDAVSVGVDSIGRIYVTDQRDAKVVVFSGSAQGDATPVAVISGIHSGIHSPLGLAINSSRNVYVSDLSVVGAILVFAPDANGDAAPIRAIRGTLTQIHTPFDVALDPHGHIYVANFNGPTITEYSALANGNASPVRVLAGPHTGLTNPVGLAICGDDTLYVADGGISPFSLRRVLVYAPGWHGDTAPRNVIQGSASQITAPFGLNFY